MGERKFVGIVGERFLVSSVASIPLGYLGHYVEFWPILDEARRIGLPIDRTGVAALTADLKAEIARINIEIQNLVPDEIKQLKPKVKDKKTGETRTGYKKPPKKLILANQFTLENNLWVATAPVVKVDPKTGKIKSKTTLVGELAASGDEWVSRWYQREDFKASSKQLIGYIEWKSAAMLASPDKVERKLARFYRVPQTIDLKTRGLRPTTGKKALQDLLDSTGDEVLLRIIGDKDHENGTLGERAGIRSLEKVINNDIPRWTPANDSSVHTTWGLTAASGQLDARNPNILNASKHTVVGKLFRKTISCSEDEILVECDKKSYHVATMGYCANSARYIRFSQIDPHSFFTAYVAKGELGLPKFEMSDREIKEICSRYKKHSRWGWVRQHISKVIVLGNQLGLGARKIFINQNAATLDPETRQRVKPFRSIEHVKGLQQILSDLFPEVDEFKKRIRRLAAQSSLTNEWGYTQKFWEVFAWKYSPEENNWYEVPGTESEKAIAFPVQSTAFGDIRDKLLQLSSMGLLARYPFVSSIHDSWVFRILRSRLERFMEEVYPVLVSPSRRLIKPCCPEGLTVGVEVFWGRNFADCSESNPEGMRELKI